MAAGGRGSALLGTDRVSGLPGDVPERGGDYEMNSACKGEAATGTR